MLVFGLLFGLIVCLFWGGFLLDFVFGFVGWGI